MTPAGLADAGAAGLTTIYSASHGKMPHPAIVGDWAMNLGVEESVVRRAIERSAPRTKRKAS